MDDIYTLKQFINAFPNAITEAQVRWWIFNRNFNRIESAGAVVKKEGRWYVNGPRMRHWILEGDRVVT